MEARLYELIRDYQADRATALGGPLAEFRADALRHFALDRPDRYPEYILDDGRLAHAIGLARIMERSCRPHRVIATSLSPYASIATALLDER